MRRQRESTLTFLLTDIENSTGHLRRLGPARYSEVVAAHRDFLLRVAEDFGGRRVDSVGDSVLIAFASPDDALRVAFATQVVLDAESSTQRDPLRVRMGVHTGPVWRRGREYVGLTVHEVARICRLAAGGQVLASADTLAATSEEVRRHIGSARLHPESPRDFEDASVFEVWSRVEASDNAMSR